MKVELYLDIIEPDEPWQCLVFDGVVRYERCANYRGSIADRKWFDVGNDSILQRRFREEKHEFEKIKDLIVKELFDLVL